MSSPKFERVKKRNPELAELLERLGVYIRAQIRNGQTFIIPKLAAAALHLTDGEAFVLLEVLTKGDVLRRVFNVYCRNEHILLATVDSIEALDQIPHCDFCDADHDVSNLRVEIAFGLVSGELMDVAA